jgi:hypothetical protein
MLELRQGDTTTIMLETSAELSGKKLKVGIYTPMGKPLFETVTDDGLIEQVDETHYALQLDWNTTRNFSGATILKLAVFTEDRKFVSAGEQSMQIEWVTEVVTNKLN